MTYKILYINKKPYLKDVFFNDIKERYNIFVATSYNEAINIIASTGIDILLCQINLDKAGYDFLKSAELVSSATIKLLIVEPADQKNSLSYLDELNIFQVIFTPFDPRLIEFNLKNALEHLQLRNTNKILFNRLSLNKNKLEEKIAERTEELERINKELQEANTLKNKLFSIISHDLMAPIYSFNIFIDVILKYNDNISFNEIKDYCFKIREYIDNVEKMIESLLKWSSFQIYKADLNNNKINLKDIIEDNFRLFKIIAQQKKIKITLQQIPDTLLAKGDENMINIILRNLISNAIKFTPADGNIIISHTVKDNHIIISVTDNGKGIAKDKLPFLFNRNSYENFEIGKSLEKGYGIGLKLCKEFVNKLNGEIWATSDPGKGSTFSFSVPIKLPA